MRCARCTLPSEVSGNPDLVICDLCCADVGEAIQLDELQLDMTIMLKTQEVDTQYGRFRVSKGEGVR